MWFIKSTYLTVNFSTSTTTPSMTFFDLAFHRFIIREFWISKRNSHVCQSPLRQWESKLFSRFDWEIRKMSLKMPKRMVICPRASSNSVKSQLEMSTLSWNSARARSTLSFFKFNGNLCHAEKTPWRSQFRTTEKIGPWSRTSPELGVVSIGLDLGRSRKATKMPMASHEVMGNPGFLDNREEAPTNAWSGMEGRRVTRQQ